MGCVLNVDVFERQVNDWYGEGDDMIFIDGEPWPPRLHGTGTEDYFNTAFCPTQEYSAPYHGITLYSGSEAWPWGGKNSMYRFHIEDPIRFDESIRVTIETGHANALANDYSSTAYWYQTGRSQPLPPLAPVARPAAALAYGRDQQAPKARAARRSRAEGVVGALPGPGPQDAQRYAPTPLARSSISARRLLFRPAGVSLLATGRASP